jgi:integrase
MDIESQAFVRAVSLPEPVAGFAACFNAPKRAVVSKWVTSIGLDPAAYGTHSLRRTKATLIYRRSKNLRAVQLVLGHTKLESIVWYLGIEVDDALEIAEQTEI